MMHDKIRNRGYMIEKSVKSLIGWACIIEVNGEFELNYEV